MGDFSHYKASRDSLQPWQEPPRPLARAVAPSPDHEVIKRRLTPRTLCSGHRSSRLAFVCSTSGAARAWLTWGLCEQPRRLSPYHLEGSASSNAFPTAFRRLFRTSSLTNIILLPHIITQNGCKSTFFACLALQRMLPSMHRPWEFLAFHAGKSHDASAHTLAFSKMGEWISASFKGLSSLASSEALSSLASSEALPAAIALVGCQSSLSCHRGTPNPPRHFAPVR